MSEEDVIPILRCQTFYQSKLPTCDSEHTEAMKNKTNSIADRFNNTYKTEVAAQGDIG